MTLVRRSKKIFLYRFLPVFLAFILVVLLPFTLAPRAKAVVSDALLPAIIEGLNAAFGIGFSAPGNTDGGKWLANEVWTSLYNFASLSENWASYAALGITEFGVWLGSKLGIVRSVDNKPVIKADSEATQLMQDYVNYQIDTYSLTSNNSSPYPIFTTSGYFLSNGTQVGIAPQGTVNSSVPPQFLVGSTYELSNGNTFRLARSQNGNYTNFRLYVNDVSQDQSTWGDVTNLDYIVGYGFKYNSETSARYDIVVIYRKTNSSTNSYAGHTRYLVSSLFGSTQTTLTGNLTTSELITDVDIPEDDESLYVPVPPIIANELPRYWTEGDVARGIEDGIADGINTNVGAQAWEASVAESADPSVPTMEVPLIGISLPSDFHLGLSGIWHYVREWLSSIGSWLTWVFSVYSNLPYGMIVPIYASIVIVIVLGLYKRFFM